MLGFLDKLLDANKREIDRFSKVVSKVNAFESSTQKLSDKALTEQAQKLKKRFQKGESLDTLLPEAFALSREASLRETKRRHFDVQLISAIALHEGKISEQRTGEGKTLSAVPAVFLNALTGKGV